MEKIKLASAAAVFDRRFYRTQSGGVPDIKENKMLITKRPENDDWYPRTLSPPVETYNPEVDGSLNNTPLQKVMEKVFLRGFQEEFVPDQKLGLPLLQYIGNYTDDKTNFAVYGYMGHFRSESSWSPRKDLKNMLHVTKEVPEYNWKTLPEVINMKEEGKIAGGKFIDMVVQEIEKRMTNDPYFREQQDFLSRLNLNL